MDGCAGKRSVDRMVLPRKASIPENMNKKNDKSVGCSSAKVSYTKGATLGGSTDNNAKVGRPPVCSSSNGKEIVGSSSRYLRKPATFTGRRLQRSNLETDSSEASSVHDGPAVAEPTKTKRGIVNVHSKNTVSGTKVGSSGRGTIIKNNHDLGAGDSLMGSSVSSSSGSEHTTVRGGGLSRNGMRSMRCTSMSDVVSANSTRISVTKRKNSDGESSSSSRASKTSVSGVKGRNQNSSGITVSDNRRNLIVPTIRGNSVVSISGRRSGTFGRSGRLGVIASPATSRQTSHPATPTDPSSSLSMIPSSSLSRLSSNTGRLRSMMPGGLGEDGPSSPSRSLVSQDGFSRYNINGIAEVLLALERIEHDQELTYERLASLETSLFSSGMIRFYDEHRDMRLDIDNMSYEELLALGDKMGTVTTALSEEALSKSLQKSIYQDKDENGPNSLNKDDDIKCSICQEEYVDGDEVGTMPCEHMYHVSCVQQWLRMKNWCPICKTSPEEEKSL
ncbi:unnamed protein product [Eruca vesicaria subsp. sativa]|uniref:RING-type E3 ubiquitin transferase n=1 Tax=Eruca vesicaria subsp. sativa TaxID=29727 RepID=A0ABC8KG74_ERUVS|nr:unnamed protein product [Eruca vesicaria subsp. sativa]